MSYLEDLARSGAIPWLSYNDKGKYDLILDNHLMSTYRACPEHFFYAHFDGLKLKRGSSNSRVWFLEFGVALHEVLAFYYGRLNNGGITEKELTDFAYESWCAHELTEFAEEKEFKVIGGAPGFMALVLQYYHTMGPQNQGIKVLGAEVAFGRNKEVLLVSTVKYNVYLAGRMDLIIDDGYFICPMDHKTFASFRSDPLSRYFTDEGPTGYIYALKEVLKTIVPEDMILKRDCSKIIMNFISKAPTAVGTERFKRLSLRKTEWELEQYRNRMADTAAHIFHDLENISSSGSRSVMRNTQLCDSWYHRECIYKSICRQQSAQGQIATISNGYSKQPLWNTETV